MLAEGSPSRRLIVLRHGQTSWNLADRAQGHADIELDETGWQQAREAAEALAVLRPVKLWSSDLTRARQTAACLEESTGLVAQLDPRLREYDVGVRSGLTRPEFEAAYPAEYAAWIAGDEGPLVEGEETTVAVQARMEAALRECLSAIGAGEFGIVVTHGACLKVGLFALLGWPWEAKRSIKGISNCGWAVIEENPAHAVPRLEGYNLTAGPRFRLRESIG